MKGSTKANVVKSYGGAGRGTSKPNTGVKSPGVKNAAKAPHQRLNTKVYKYHQNKQGLI